MWRTLRGAATGGSGALVAAVLAAGALMTTTPTDGAEPGENRSPDAEVSGPYEVVLHARDHMLPMRDGVRLATDIYRPARDGTPADGPFPILLHRTPYDKSATGTVSRGEWFASHGYVVVIQDTRGRFGSEGAFSKYYEYDAYDGYDTVEWLSSELPFGSGRVGMWGTSYPAHTQADLAKLDPPGLGTLVVNMGGTSNGWEHKVRNHGAFELGQQIGWAFQQLAAETDDPVVTRLLETEDVGDWIEAIPFRRGLNPLSIAPNFEDYVLTMMTHGDYDEYWKGLGVNWEEYYEQTADIPILHVGGWYDSYAGGTVHSFAELSRMKSSPQRLIMGPWDHGGNTRSHAGDVQFGADAAIPDFHGDLHLRWFDHHLKGVESGVEDWAPARIFVMGTGDGSLDESGRLNHGGYWRHEAEWPIPETRFVKYYFHADGSLRTEPPTDNASSTTYRYDPAHPVPTIGGSFSGLLKRGPFNQREQEFLSFRGGSANGFYGSRPPYLPLGARPDVVVFQTDPLEEDVEVVGPIEVRLFASSSAVDTDFTAKLVDVYAPDLDFPSGFDMNITDGILRARYRESPERQEMMRPGDVYEFVIRPFPTANVFKEGNRIRIDISSSNFPRFDVNPNTGDPIGTHRRAIPADNSIHHSAEHPSYVILPIVPTAH